MKYPFFRFCIIVFILLISNFIFIPKVHAQFTINENFHGNVVGNNIMMGGAPAALLTSGSSDPVNAGWLRLTNADQFQKGYAYINKSFPSTLGILIDFEYKTWRNVVGEGGGDGFSVYLFDSSATFSLGGYGGSLGYAPDGNVLGLAGGYLGIGFDEYGNFSNPTQGRVGGPGLKPNSIVLRGQTTTSALTSNKYLTGIELDANTNPIGYASPVFTRPADTEFYRRVKISIVPIGTLTNPKYTITVMWRTSPTGNDVTLLTYDTVDPIPANLKLGFAASTGGSTNYHEIRNLLITTPGGVRIDKSVDKLNAKVGDKLTYKIDVYNSTVSPITNLLLLDTLKSTVGSILASNMMEINSITFNNNNNIGNTASGFTTGVPVTAGFTNPFKINSLNMAANTVSTFTVVATIKGMPIGGIIKNTAVVDISKTGIDDKDLTNNTSTVITSIPNTDFIVKNNFDEKCADTTNGNTLTLLVSNIGSTSSVVNNVVTVKDTIPSVLTVMSTTNIGWTVSHTDNIYTFTRSDALTSTSSYPTISIKVKPPTTGVKWGNSATVSYAGIEANTNNNSDKDTLYAIPIAPTVTSPITYCNGSTAAALTATGNKLLWYTSETGTGSPVAPIPSTATSGSTTYYVSEINGTCESVLIPIVINVSECSVNIIIPNAFTPNGDGFNDTFGPTTEGIKEIKMNINDRNGRLVFSIDSINGQWDGLMQTGEQAPVGVYFYKYNAKGIDNKSYIDQGSVSLFREMIDPTPVQVTPNPVKQNAKLDLSNVMNGSKTISIYNTSGKQIRTWNTSDDILKLDLSNFDKGLYILKITGNQQVQFVKFIKE